MNDEHPAGNAESDHMESEPPGGDVIRVPPMRANLREVLPKIVSDLSAEQLAEVVRDLRNGFFGTLPIGTEPGAELARLIEPTAPELAEQLRALRSPQEVIAWIQMWLAVLQVILGVMALNDDPPQPNQIVINIEHNETTINLPPPPPLVPPAEDG